MSHLEDYFFAVWTSGNSKLRSFSSFSSLWMFRKWLNRMKGNTEAEEEMDIKPAQSYGTVAPTAPTSPSANKPQSPIKQAFKPGIVNSYFKVDSEKSLCDLASQSQDSTFLQSNSLQPPSQNDDKSLQVSQMSLCPSTVNDNRLLLDENSTESTLRVIGEIIVPFFLAGLGCVFAGVVLDYVKVLVSFKH